MSNDQINAAIAKACGWTDVHLSVGAMYGFPTERKIAGIPPNRFTHNECPNYCTDLNAMHEAEKVLTDDQFKWDPHWVEKLMPETKYRCYLCATARHRAEAFVRSLGKWEEVQS